MFELTHFHSQPSYDSSGTSPASTSRRSSCFSSPITRRRTFAAWRWAASLSFVCRPCLRLASEMRSKPSGVRAPVDSPPWAGKSRWKIRTAIQPRICWVIKRRGARTKTFFNHNVIAAQFLLHHTGPPHIG